jgi:exopolysaccharide biosynthesis polyprenyl glycosylphosphotransferase
MTTAVPSWLTVDDSVRLVTAPSRGRTATVGRRSMRRYADLLFLTDSLVVLGSLVTATLARFGAEDASVRVLGTPTGYWLVAGFIAVTWILALTIYRSRDVRVIGSGSIEYRRVTSATAMLFGLDAIILVVVNANISRGFFIIAFPLGLASLLITRRLWRFWLVRRRRMGRYVSSTIVVGPRPDVVRVLTTLNANPAAPYRAVGVALEGGDTAQELTIGSRSYPVIQEHSTFADDVRTRGIDVVIVAGQPSDPDFIRNLGWDLERTQAEMLIASRLVNVAGPRIHMRPAEGLPLMHVELPSYEGGKHVLKRVLDFTASLAGLVLLSPLFLAIAVIVKATSPGPVFFRQARVGRNGDLFSMIKFRSMVPDAEDALERLRQHNEGSGLLFKLKDDPRVTPIGRVLRRYSLDELPQLWNVLVGHMSLVGPRPPLESEVRQYEKHVLRRLYIKPGLTGMWQINGRSNLSWEESVRLDLYYVENWSLTGDLLILWRTARVVLKPVGAY